MSDPATVQIRGIRKSALSGAITETFKSIDKKQESSNFFVRVFINFYNFIASRWPFYLAISPSSIAVETTLYTVQDGQYTLAIG